MNCPSRDLQGIAMETSNAENRDAAIQRLLDRMRIPAENRPAATSALLKLIEFHERQSQWTLRDAEARFLRISKLCEKLLKELEGVPPALHFFACEPESSDAIRSLINRLPFKTRSSGPHIAHPDSRIIVFLL
jgi:hypothetical protein